MNEILKIMGSMEYGPAPEEDGAVKNWLKSHASGFGHFINGKFTDVGVNTFAAMNPATNETVGKVAVGNASDVEIPGLDRTEAENIKQLLMGKIQKQL